MKKNREKNPLLVLEISPQPFGGHFDQNGMRINVISERGCWQKSQLVFIQI